MFSEWLSSMNSSAEKVNKEQRNKISWADRSVREVEPIPIIQFSENEVSYVNSEPVDIGMNLENVAKTVTMRSMVKIDMEDVQPEVDYWINNLLCYWC